MNDPSPLSRLLTIVRDFGIGVTVRILYSKVRGILRPASALPDAPGYNAAPREVSILLCTSEHSCATIEAVVEVLAKRDRSDWEVCICKRCPVGPEIARTIGRLHGTQPWIRIVTAPESVDDATAARWTVEQATGRFVALLAPAYRLEAGAMTGLVNRLNSNAGIDSATLAETAHLSPQPADCLLLLQRKSEYLANFQPPSRLAASALANDLDAAGVPMRISHDGKVKR